MGSDEESPIPSGTIKPSPGEYIKSTYLREVHYLDEISNQVFMALQAQKRLLNGAKAFWDSKRVRTPENVYAESSAPGEQLRNAHSMLTHSAIVGRFLFVGRRKGKRFQELPERCERLRSLLGVTTLPVIQKLSLRNGFEHIDEKLDELRIQPSSQISSFIN